MFIHTFCGQVPGQEPLPQQVWVGSQQDAGGWMHRLRICSKCGSAAAASTARQNPRVTLARTPFPGDLMDTTRQSPNSSWALICSFGCSWEHLGSSGEATRCSSPGQWARREQQPGEGAVRILLTGFPACSLHSQLLTRVLGAHLSCKITSKSGAALQSPAPAGSSGQSPSFQNFFPGSAQLHGVESFPVHMNTAWRAWWGTQGTAWRVPGSSCAFPRAWEGQGTSQPGVQSRGTRAQ